MNKKYFSRRHFLRSSTSLVALPILPSLGFNRHLHAASSKKGSSPKRIVFISMGFGVNKAWYASASEPGYGYKLPPTHKPLEKYKKDFTITRNFEHAHGGDPHAANTYWLTGADRYFKPGSAVYNSISVDQIAANQFGKETRYTSFNLGATGESHGHGRAMSFNRGGKPRGMLGSPDQFYSKLFFESDVPLEERIGLLNDQRSVLDSLRVNANSIKKNMSPEDLEKLDEYLTSIREIEVRLTKEKKWIDRPKEMPKNPIKQPAPELKGRAGFKMMIDLMIAAMEVDASRVFTYRAPTASLLEDIGVFFSPHTLSHLSGFDVAAAAFHRDREFSSMFAYFIKRLKETKDKDGQSLFDNTTVVQGAMLSHVHLSANSPTLITGNGAGFKHGRNLAMKKTTPLCNLWLSILKGSGVNVDSFSDSTGVVDELYRA